MLSRDVDIAQIEAKRATESKDEELKREVEVKRAAAEMERLRAHDVVRATIARESKQQAADAKAYEVQADARANLDAANQRAQAEAYKIRTEADASNYAAIKEAEANLQVQLKEAEGMAAVAGAYGKMAQAFGGPAGLIQFLMIKEGTYVQLANANAKAVQGMAPKISVWNTGAQAGEGGSAGNSSIDAMRSEFIAITCPRPVLTRVSRCLPNAPSSDDDDQRTDRNNLA